MSKKSKFKGRAFSLKSMERVNLNSKRMLESDSSKKMRDKHYVARALLECLIENDIATFKEILKTHLELEKKDSLAKKAGISRRTLFRLLSPEGNPTLETVGKIIHQLCA